LSIFIKSLDQETINRITIINQNQNQIMKKLKLSIFLLFLFSININAQITIDQADLPAANDTFRVSIGDILQVNIDPVPTGVNFTWDFSMLTPTSQNVDSFIDESAPGSTYALIFIDLGLNPNRANQAARGSVFGGLPQIPGGNIGDIYNFYYKNASQYKQVGVGANIMAQDVPLAFDNKDIIYNLPLNYNDVDSCDADASLSLPGLGYYAFTQHRVSTVEGWGTLITPYGSFNTIKVKSVVTGHDTLYLDTLSIGFGVDRQLVTEYKWLGVGEGIPLLQINTTDAGGTEVITSIRYRDSVRAVFTAVNDIEDENQSLSVMPNPLTDKSVIGIKLRKSNAMRIELLDVTGKLISVLADKLMLEGSNEIIMDKNALQLKSGVYFIKAYGDKTIMVEKIIVE